MVPGPAGSSTPKTIYKSDDGIILAYGTSAPSDASSGYAEGCVFAVVNGSGGATLYVNEGSATSSDFNLIITEDNISAQAASLLEAADVATIIGTGASSIDADDANTIVDSGMPPSGTAAGVGPSPLIWDDAPVLDTILNPQLGTYYFTDFKEFGGLSLAANGSDGGLTLVERTEGTLANDPTVPGGIVNLSSVNNTADQGGTMQILGCQCEPGDGTTIRMEWRCKVSEDGGQCFMGLAEDAVSAIVDSDDAIVTNNLAGFYRDAGTGDADWTVGCADGSSADEADDKATSVKTTYNKYGIVISGKGGVAGSTIKYYFNGALIHTITDVNDIPLLLMCPQFQMDGDDTDIVTMSIDWLRVLVSHATGACRES